GQNFPLASLLEGDVETLIQSCISQDQQERLEALAAESGEQASVA
ncbi:MAG: peptide chain release factor 1, partial [Phormidesmis sp. CAN_BIN44]|nr:peptide chain release factor 1 [Phormidesmis sp. CAN_BIN44]